VTCTACPHEAHYPHPCSACAAQNTSCAQAIRIVGGDGDHVARGEIEMATGIEQRPCCMCRSFEQDRPKLIRHLLRNKLTPDENGVFRTPIAKDIPGRKSLVIDPRTYGWCRRDTIVVDMLATCPAWTLVRTTSELESRIKS
jgi:hypothetical protein